MKKILKRKLVYNDVILILIYIITYFVFYFGIIIHQRESFPFFGSLLSMFIYAFLGSKIIVYEWDLVIVILCYLSGENIPNFNLYFVRNDEYRSKNEINGENV